MAGSALDSNGMNIHSLRVASPATRRDAADKREAILEAALGLFAERGFHGTPVPLVAEVAGVGAGTLYRYFDSKEALVNALYQRCKAAMGEAILTAFPVDAPPRKQFHELWSRLSAFARENATALAFLELHHHGPYLDEKSRAMDEVMLGPARAFVERAQAQGEVKPYLPDLLIAVVFGSFVGVVKGCRERAIELSPEVLDAAEQCAWDAIRRLRSSQVSPPRPVRGRLFFGPK